MFGKYGRWTGTAILAAACLVLAAGAGPDGATRYRQALELHRQARACHEKKDYAGFRRAMEQVHRLLPEDPEAAYGLACGRALTGDRRGALKLLSPLVRAGIAFGTGTDPDLAGLSQEPSYRALAEQARQLMKPVIRGTRAFSIAEKDLIPEGIARDPSGNAFYLGSLSKSKIVRIDGDGTVSDFAVSRQDGLLPVLGLRVDDARRRLWVCNNFGYPREGLEPALFGTAGVHLYDLAGGRLLRVFRLPQAENHFLNDVCLTPDGTAYFSDSHVPGVWRIRGPEGQLELAARLDDFTYPNGIAHSPDTDRLFVACSEAVVAVDLRTGRVARLRHAGSLFSGALDGLYYYRGGLIGVQNGIIPQRVVRLELDRRQERITRLQILESNNPVFAVPTTGAIAGNCLYLIASSQLHRFDGKGKLAPLDQLRETEILKIPLD